MPVELDHTHDAAARSWVASANEPGCEFPIQNLPLASFRRQGVGEPYRVGVAIGDQILDLAALSHWEGPTSRPVRGLAACRETTLNALMRLGRPAWRELRHALFALLHADLATPADREVAAACLVPQSEAKYGLPVEIGDYSDYYTSLYHAVNIGKLFGIQTEGSNFEWLPIAYHGRASSIGVSGQTFPRPKGQLKAPGAAAPTLGPCAKLDYEVELALYIGTGNAHGHPIQLDAVDDHVFGFGLLNDWSARDIQAWEMHPLGPFLSKNFATTVSPWVVTLDALAPFRRAFERPPSAPAPLSYLDSVQHRETGAVDIQIEAWLEPPDDGPEERRATRLSRTSFRHQYWTAAQMVAQHTVNGCNLRTGDVLGTGTISGPTAAEAGAFMELAQNGAKPVRLDSGGERSFVQDGDTIILRGFCERPGYARIGFGESRGQVLPAIPEHSPRPPS